MSLSISRSSEGDYVLDDKDCIYMVKNPAEGYVIKVFSPCKDGRKNQILNRNYVKDLNDKIECLEDVVKIFQPKKAFQQNYEVLPGIWHQIPKVLINAGIPRKDIGIIGSYLVGFDIEKDVDFIVYGLDNCKKLKSRMDDILLELGCKHISYEHVRHQAKKYRQWYNKENDFENLLSNKWSSIQIRKGLCSTIRFSYNKDEIPEDIAIRAGTKRKICGKVTDSIGTAFIPRIFRLDTGVCILTYGWPYHCCVREGMELELSGEFYQHNNTLYLNKDDSYIKIRKKNYFNSISIPPIHLATRLYNRLPTAPRTKPITP